MAMNKIDPSVLKVGVKFTKSLYSPNLEIILPAGKVLDSYKLKSVLNRNYDYLETAGEMVFEEKEKKLSNPAESGKSKKIKVDKETAKYLSLYRESVNAISGLYNQYKLENRFNTDRLQKIASNLVSAVLSEKNSNLFINLVNLVGKGDYLYSHIINTTLLSILLGRKIDYSMVKLMNLALSGLLFDMGMTKIPAYIVEKEKSLTPEEFNQIKTHPIYSYQIISRELNLPVEIARVGLEHHEKWDGTGYPRHLKGQAISEMTRIISIIDTYEALTKERVYRDKKDSYNAMKMVLGEGSKKFDPELLKVFLNMMSIYPVGSFVKLNNNAIAKVISSDPVSPFRPNIKIIYDEFGDLIENGESVRLSKEKQLYIVKSINPGEPSNAISL